MIQTRKKRIIVGACSIALSLCIVIGALLGIHAYREYYEEAIPAEGFLPRPDKITLYYKNEDSETFKTKRLITRKDIDLIYNALEVMLSQCDRAGRTQYYFPWDAEKYVRDREKFGYMEFHYNQRREFAYRMTNPRLENEADADYQNTFSFTGEFDSVSMDPLGYSVLSFVGCKNGEYYRNDKIDGEGYMHFPKEVADAFWETVMSCVK